MDWITETWAQITQLGISGGTIVLLAYNTFVSTRLGSKRVDKLLDFTTVAHRTFTDVSNIIKNSLEAFKSELIATVVRPLQVQIKTEQDDKVFWQNIAVSALAVANVPVNQKQAMYDFAKKATSISAEAFKVLEQSIANDIKATQEITQQSSDLSNALNEV